MVSLPAALAWYYSDEQPVRDMWWHPAAGEQVIDIGCMMGNYSLPALAAGASVVAVDPASAGTGTLRSVADANGFSGRLIIRNVALFDGGAYPDGLNAAQAASPWANLAPAPGVPFMTLDELTADCALTRLDWVKIDVEGAEAGVLRGGMKSLEQWHPVLLIEDHSVPYPWVAEQQITRQCTELLESLGYTVRQWRFDEPRMFLIAS
jgi:FkbM family methyltransferase